MKTVCVCDLNFPLQKRMKTLSVEKLEKRVGYCLKFSADVTTETSLGTENITKCAQENQETTMHKEDKSSSSSNKQTHGSKFILCKLQVFCQYMDLPQKENCTNTGKLPFSALQNFVYRPANYN